MTKRERREKEYSILERLGEMGTVYVGKYGEGCYGWTKEGVAFEGMVEVHEIWGGLRDREPVGYVERGEERIPLWSDSQKEVVLAQLENEKVVRKWREREERDRIAVAKGKRMIRECARAVWFKRRGDELNGFDAHGTGKFSSKDLYEWDAWSETGFEKDKKWTEWGASILMGKSLKEFRKQVLGEWQEWRQGEAIEQVVHGKETYLLFNKPEFEMFRLWWRGEVGRLREAV